MASWLPIVPERTRRAAGWPVREAMWDSRDWVVGSSAKTSSRRVQDWMEVSIEGVGVVTTSPRLGQRCCSKHLEFGLRVGN